MDAIVSVTRDWGIGRNGGLLVRNKADMRRFKELTMGGSVIMGRQTFEGLPGGPLPGRNNIVLTRNRDFSLAGIEVASSIDEATREDAIRSKARGPAGSTPKGFCR